MRLPPPPRRRRSGFTLVELILSSVLMSVILTAAYVCLRAGLAGRALVAARSDVTQSARVALALISADLRSASPLSNEFEFIGMERTLDDIEADNLDFGTHHYSPTRAGEGDFCEVSYYLDKDRATGEVVLYRRRDASLDARPLEGGSREEIVRGVRGLKFEYYDGFEWYDVWGDPEKRDGGSAPIDPLAGNLSGLPEAVRITLSLDPNPGSPKKDEADDNPEPPLVFQTVARINLAPYYYLNSSSSRSSGNNSSTSASAAGTR